MRIVMACALAALVAGCVTTETVQFRPKAQQEAMIRDGQAALISRRKNSIVMIKPASRQFQVGGRPVYAVGIYNLSGVPINFLMANVQVNQLVNNQTVALKVFTYDELVTEERNRQVAMAIIGGLAAGANAYSASQAGRYSSTSTVRTRTGTSHNGIQPDGKCDRAIKRRRAKRSDDFRHCRTGPAKHGRA